MSRTPFGTGIFPWQGSGGGGRRRIGFNTGIVCPICGKHPIIVCGECDEGHWVRCRDYRRQGPICPSLDRYGDRYLPHDLAVYYADHIGNPDLMCELILSVYPEYSAFVLREEEPTFAYGPPST